MISSNWEGLLEGLGLMNEEGVVVNSKDAIGHIEDRLVRVREAKKIVQAEGKRKSELESRGGLPEYKQLP